MIDLIFLILYLELLCYSIHFYLVDRFLDDFLCYFSLRSFEILVRAMDTPNILDFCNFFLNNGKEEIF